MSLWKTLWNRVRYGADKLDKSMQSTAIDGNYKIQDAKKEYDRFTGNIANLGAKITGAEKEVETLQKKVDKFTKIAQQAAKEQNAADVTAAIKEKNNIQGLLTTKQAVLSQLRTQYDNMIKMRQQLQDHISSDETNLASLTAREEAAKMMIEMNKVAAGMASSSAVSGLGEFEANVAALENQAAAYGNLAAQTNVMDTLESKYSGDTSVDDEVAALMAANAKPETTAKA